ncbi:cytochrome P450 [Serendipita vermifera]|nr:cytochrome P450 [Serendipita vermifera]
MPFIPADVISVLPLEFVTRLRVAIALVLVIIGPPIFRLSKGMIGTYLSPLRNLPGPLGGGILLGYSKEISKAGPGEWHLAMVEKYGHVLRYRGLLGADRLFTVDPKALNHILNNTIVYQKPGMLKYTFRFLNQGLLFSNGSQHKRQRRIVNPSFSTSHIREMTEIFIVKSHEMREILLEQLKSPEASETVDMLKYLSSVTLDIIGVAGFNYEFNSLKNDNDELSMAFDGIINIGNRFPIFQLLKELIPFLRPILRFDITSKDLAYAERTFKSVGMELIRQKKNEIEEEIKSGKKGASKDLLTLLIRSNLNEKGDKLTDEELIHQIPNFLIAGHETTSTSTTWGLLSLAAHKPLQTRLRNELRSISTDFPTMEELNSLPYLDAVIREILRYNSVISSAPRLATQDDLIPLEQPYIDRYGTKRESITVRKGDNIFISIAAVNRSTSIWGEDARVFNPDRWLDLPNATYLIPGVWGNQLTFLGGPRGCIGFKFAIIEMKAILFSLLRTFEFDLAVPEDDVIRLSSVTARPGLKSEKEKGYQIPLIVKVTS